MNELRDSWRMRAAVLLGFVALLWFVHGLNTMAGRRVFAVGHGVVPRTLYGLYGIPTAPLIHEDLDHLISNSIPLLILGALVMLRGVFEFCFVVFTSAMIGGLGTWLFGASGEHFGASDIVFGLFGYLVFRTAFDRRWSSALITLAVAVGYGTSMAMSLIPTEHVSWSGHFFGFVGGFLAARIRYPHNPNRKQVEATVAMLHVVKPPR